MSIRRTCLEAIGHAVAACGQRRPGLTVRVLTVYVVLGPAASAADGAKAATLMVTTARTDGAGSLSDAITRANLVAAPALIAFDLPTTDPGFGATAGVWALRLAAALPALTRGRTTIDGSTQPAPPNHRPGLPRIAIVAAQPGVNQAFSVVSAGNAIHGVAIGGFRYGVVLYGPTATANTVADCVIGLEATGATPHPNETGVLVVEGAHGNTLSGNTISGNAQSGVYIGGLASTHNTLLRNNIGCDGGGHKRLPNGLGLMLAKSSDNVIGGVTACAGNLISGNADIGILLVGKGTERNLILGNRIGTDQAGERPLHNNIGIVLKALANHNMIGGAAAGAGNVVSGNREIGIYIEAADGNRILGNLIGTDRSGRRAVQEGDVVQGNGVEFNTVAKLNVLGGLGEGAWNLISGNTAFGAYFYNHGTHANILRGNRIGTDLSGTRALPNETGVHIDGGTFENLVAGNLVSGNLVAGITLFALHTDRNRIVRNRIGTDITGELPLGNGVDGIRIAFGPSDNRIGGTAEEANTIAHNGGYGVRIESGAHNAIAGNTIRDNAKGDLHDAATAAPPPGRARVRGSEPPPRAVRGADRATRSPDGPEWYTLSRLLSRGGYLGVHGNRNPIPGLSSLQLLPVRPARAARWTSWSTAAPTSRPSR